MPVNLVTVTGNLETLSGATPSLGRLRFKLDRTAWNLSGDIFAPEYVEAVANASGAFSVDLQSTDGLEGGPYYSAILRYVDTVTSSDKETTIGRFQLPSGGPHQLGDLLVVPVVPPLAPDVLAICQAAAVSSATNASNSATSASQAALFDGPILDSWAAFSTDTQITYTPAQPGTVVAGDWVSFRNGQPSFRVAASGASDHNATSAGGVKAYNSSIRTAPNATYWASLASGTIVEMGGLKYRVDPTATGTASATSDLGVAGLRAVEPISIYHFGGITQDSTDISPIVSRAIVATQAGEVINIPAGTYRWATALIVDHSTLPAMTPTVFRRAPKIRGAKGCSIKTSVSGYMIEVRKAWTGSPSLASGLEISGLNVSLQGSPVTPRFLRIMAQYDAVISDNFMNGLINGITLDCDYAGDQQSSVNVTIQRNRIELPANGEGIKMASSVAGGVSGAYIKVNHNAISGGATGLHLDAFDQVIVDQNEVYTQTGHNVLIAYNGLTNRNLTMHQNEIGNNTNAAASMVTVRSLLNGKFSNMRMIRNAAELGSVGYYFNNVSGSSIQNVVMEQDFWIVAGAGSFDAYRADASIPTNGLEIVRPYYSQFVPTNARISNADKFSPRYQTYTTSGTTVFIDPRGEGEHRVSMSATAAISRNPGSTPDRERFRLTFINTGGASVTPALSGFYGPSPGAIPTGKRAWAECFYDVGTTFIVVASPWVIQP